MREFYGQNRAPKPLPSPATGQLAAVKTEEEEEFLRAQVCEVTADKVKVRTPFSPYLRIPVGVADKVKLQTCFLPYLQIPAVMADKVKL